MADKRDPYPIKVQLKNFVAMSYSFKHKIPKISNNGPWWDIMISKKFHHNLLEIFWN